MDEGDVVSTAEPGRKPKTQRAYEAFSMSSIGLEMGLCILIGWGIGYYLDKEFETDPYLMFVFLGAGIAAGFKALIRAARKAKSLAAESEE